MKKIVKKSGSMISKLLTFALIAAMVSVPLALSGCGSGSSTEVASENSDTAYTDGQSVSGFSEEENLSDVEAEEAADNQASSTTKSTDENLEAASEKSTEEDYSQKLIYTYNFSFETEDFDKSVSFIEKTLDQYNGYIETSSLYGEENRTYEMTLRIPVAHMDDFLAETGSIGTLISKEVSTQDISLEYYDLEAHLETLNTQRDRLLALLKKADTVKDITEIQSQISDIEYEINSYNTQLKVYDNQVDYATVYMNLTEVERISAAKEDGFITRIKEGLAGNTSNVLNDIVEFVIWFITMIPYFLVLLVLGSLITFVVRAIRRKKPDAGKKSSGKKKNVKSENGKDGTKDEGENEKTKNVVADGGKDEEIKK